MPRSILLLAALLALGACASKPRPLNTEEKVVRAVLRRLASDGKPVCVSRVTFHSPLSVHRIAIEGDLQKVYSLGWFPPHPFRPPAMPDLEALQRSDKFQRNAKLAEPLARKDRMSRRRQRGLEYAAFMLGPPEVETRAVHIRDWWAPPRVFPRWWPWADASKGCTNHFVLSGVKANRHIAFVGVRVDHWGTIYALAPLKDDWRPIAQWATWLY